MEEEREWVTGERCRGRVAGDGDRMPSARSQGRVVSSGFQV